MSSVFKQSAIYKSVLRLSVTGGLLSAVLGLTAAAQTVVTIPTTTYQPGQPVVVSVDNQITTGDNTVVVSDKATVIYHATSKVTLKPGFSVVAGGKFFAMAGPSLDTDGDGIPDVWERAYGLDPNNPADALSLAPNGLTYLAVYQLGMIPTASLQDDTGNTTQLKIHQPN